MMGLAIPEDGKKVEAVTSSSTVAIVTKEGKRRNRLERGRRAKEQGSVQDAGFGSSSSF